MAEDPGNDPRVIEMVLDLHGRGFKSHEFRESGGRAIEKIAMRKSTPIEDDVIDVLVDWLAVPASDGEEGALKVPEDDEKERSSSILFGHGYASVLPAGNFTILSTLATILLNRREPGRDRYFSVLQQHLPRERDPNVWRALLSRLGNAGGATPKIVSAFVRDLFSRFPGLLGTREAVMFLAYAQRWDQALVFELTSDWKKSESKFQRRGYGELVGLVSLTAKTKKWTAARTAIISSGDDDARLGLAHAAINLWGNEDFRQAAGKTLVALLDRANKSLVATVMDVFRVVNELPVDKSTVELLRALATDQIDLSGTSSHYVVEALQSFLPNEAELVAKLAERLVSAWRAELGDVRTSIAMAAPQLTDLALTLHRIGGKSRRSGVKLFEAMIEIDAYGARDTLAELDGRFGEQQTGARQRLSRRRKRGPGR